jgi:hypothetical protein
VASDNITLLIVRFEPVDSEAGDDGLCAVSKRLPQ